MSTAPNAYYADLLTACEQPGCPLCLIEQRSVTRYLKTLYFEAVNDPEVRDHLRRERAFCVDHAHLLLDSGLGDALGTAIIYHDILGDMLRGLQDLSAPVGGSLLNNLLRRPSGQLADQSNAARRVLAHQRCRVCSHVDEIQQHAQKALVESLTDEKLLAALRKSDGICFPHLDAVLARVYNPQGLANLLQITGARLEALRAELSEFIRKNDYRFQHERMGAEGDSWKRVLRLVAGEPNPEPKNPR